jgi:uncharacterized protein YcfJ
MKKLIFILALIGTPVMAMDYARVVNSQPRYVTVHQRQCQVVTVQQDNSGSGALVGAITGGILGNQVGEGKGRDAATVLGAIVGANVGERMGQDQVQLQTKEVCRTVPVQVQQGYVLTLDYRGELITIQTNRN